MGAILCMETAYDEGFQRQVKYFMQKAAVAAIGELDTTPGHTERVAYANTVLTGEANIREYAIAVVTNATIASTINSAGTPSDSDVEFTVNSMYNDFAGYDG